MSGEYHEPPLGSGHPLAELPHELLATTVIRDFVRYEKAQAIHENLVGAALDGFRLGSITDELHQSYALAAPQRHGTNPMLIQGNLYQVNVDTRQVQATKDIIIVRPEYADGLIFEKEIDELTYGFNKIELEAVARILGRMITELSIDCQHALVERLGWMSNIPLKSNKDTSPFLVDQEVKKILAQENLDQLAATFPETRETATPPEPISTTRHVLECRDFMTEANNLLERETDSASEDAQEVSVMHETLEGTYIINLSGENCELTNIEIFCYDRGLWKGQIIELGDAYEDDGHPDIMSPAWDMRRLLVALKQGIPISHSLYESYAAEARHALGPAGDLSYSNLLTLHEKEPAE